MPNALVPELLPNVLLPVPAPLLNGLEEPGAVVPVAPEVPDGSVPVFVLVGEDEKPLPVPPKEDVVPPKADVLPVGLDDDPDDPVRELPGVVVMLLL